MAEAGFSQEGPTSDQSIDENSNFAGEHFWEFYNKQEREAQTIIFC